MESLIESLLDASHAEAEHHMIELVQQLKEIAKQYPSKDDIVFVCVGSDQSTGDAFGPLTGTMLEQLGFPHVIGTMALPCDAYKVEQAVKQLPVDKVIIAIDACLGQEKSVGTLKVQPTSIQPGAALGRRLPFIGQYSIIGIVNQVGPKAYWRIQNTSLYTVMKMVAQLRRACVEAWVMNKEA